MTIVCHRRNATGIIALLVMAVWFCPAALAQEANSQATNPKAKPAAETSNRQKKKPAEPFRWVNPLRPQDEKLPGLEHHTFVSSSLDREVGYCIYLPPSYHHTIRHAHRYPVVYYLHGGRPGSERKSIRLVEIIHDQIQSDAVPPAIYVFVNGGPVSHYNLPDRPDAQGADVFIKELIPHIDKTYRTKAHRSKRALEGFSQGGRGTARLMFRHPELFCSAAPGGGGHATEKRISESGGYETEKLKFAEGDNTWDLATDYARRLADQNNETPKLKILVHVGDKGFNYSNNLQWMEHLNELGIEHQKIIVPDVGHSAMEIYRKRGRDIMLFHAKNFGHYQAPRDDE